ncbi:hypothetical protein [Haloferula sp. A504]|uniref:hypothetical protein n=1 Tax=Haloferula sp. A504 TaxID=3373601 RepID=UPI0031C61701|nr:hypothetical protein [Verrucomicrobiaceae bacterium E54]
MNIPTNHPLKRFFMVAALILVAPFLAAAATLNVPDDHDTIQAAVDAASPGDTIEVDAAYSHNSLRTTIDGKNLTINGNDATIDGAIDIRGGAQVVVNGLTISGIPNTDPSDNSGWSTVSSSGPTGARYVISVRGAGSSLTADDLNITQTGFPDANISGVEMNQQADVTITSSSINLTGGNVYAFYIQDNAGNLDVDQVDLTLDPERQRVGNSNQNAIMIGSDSSGAFPSFSITNYTFAPVIENDQRAYKVQLYAGGSGLSNSQINTWLDTVLVGNEVSRVIYDSTGWLEYPSNVFNTTQGLPAFTIQGGINAANAGDTIEVAPGTVGRRRCKPGSFRGWCRGGWPAI